MKLTKIKEEECSSCENEDILDNVTGLCKLCEKQQERDYIDYMYDN